MNSKKPTLSVTQVLITLAIFGLVAIKATQAYRAGSLGLYATVMLSVALLVGTLIGADLFLQKRRSTEWMTRFRTFAWGGFLVFGMVLIGARISFESIQAKREGGFGAFAATLLTGALVTGAIIGADLFLQRRRSAEWMMRFRICVTLAVVAAIVGLCVYLLSGKP